MIIVLETTLPALRMRYSRSENSMGWSSIVLSARFTSLLMRFIERSPTASRVGSVMPLARRTSAWTLARSSVKAKGFVR
ncbi:MAG: hypothetical protein A4E61_00556 [Syntrophorhabdus sp. PtaB.Bin184]|nr:MAG: hypothetical protein A4E61_00556 [Syntrophorhabdus sp. PtaB.Bin184]